MWSSPCLNIRRLLDSSRKVPTSTGVDMPAVVVGGGEGEVVVWEVSSNRSMWLSEVNECGAGVAMGVDFVTAVIALTAGALIHRCAQHQHIRLKVVAVTMRVNVEPA